MNEKSIVESRMMDSELYFVGTTELERECFRRHFGDDGAQFVDELGEVGPRAVILSAFIDSRIDARFLHEHPQLELVTTRSTTFDHIDRHECARRGISVAYVPTYGDHTVAEHTFALMLGLTRRLREVMEISPKASFSYDAIRGVELRGKTLGIVGTGRVGLHTIEIARAFRMEVLAYDVQEQPEEARRLGFRYVPLHELLQRSEIISLHAALTAESYHLLDRAAFSHCRPGSLIINTARGELIDTGALVEALDAGIIAGAGLDVLEEERSLRKKDLQIVAEDILRNVMTSSRFLGHDPARSKNIQELMRNSALLSRRDVIFTPHVAFNTVEAMERIDLATIEAIKGFRSGRPVNIVTPPTLETAPNPAVS